MANLVAPVAMLDPVEEQIMQFRGLNRRSYIEDGEMPDMNGMPSPPDFNGGMPFEQDREETEVSSSSAEAASADMAFFNMWIQYGICAAVLLAAILFAVVFKRTH